MKTAQQLNALFWGFGLNAATLTAGFIRTKQALLIQAGVQNV